MGAFSAVSDLTTSREIAMADLSKHLDKAYESKSFEELVDAPVDALEGVSKSDAELLLKAFNIRTIRDLAESKFVLRAQAITTSLLFMPQRRRRRNAYL
jgi:hypothetical protein